MSKKRTKYTSAFKTKLARFNWFLSCVYTIYKILDFWALGVLSPRSVIFQLYHEYQV